jgi:Holliday junction resolvase RusA-like endonuclease
VIFSIPYEPPSQNKTSRQHWSARKRDVDLCTNLIRVYAGLTDQATGPRKVNILAYRKRLCTDIENYRGGCKSLCDAIVRRGLLVDDNDKMASFTYEQRLMPQMPADLKAKFGGRPCTTIEITDI